MFEAHSNITFDQYGLSNSTVMQFNSTVMQFNSTIQKLENENYCSEFCYMLTFISLIVFDVFYGVLIIMVPVTILIVKYRWSKESKNKETEELEM